MKPFENFLRTSFLAFLTLSLVGGGIATDYYFRHELTRKASRFLEESGVPATTDSAIAAARLGDLVLMEQLELAGVDPGGPDLHGLTPLLAAMRAGQEEMSTYLLGSEQVIATVDQETSPQRDTAMGHALRKRDFALADQLISLGASVDVDQVAASPFLIEAIRNRDTEMVDYLLERNADVAYQGAQAHSALAIAASLGNLSLVERLVDAGADVNVLGLSGQPLLIEAIEAGNYESLEFFVSRGAEVDVRATDTGKPALEMAIDQQDGWIRHLMLEAGASPDAANAEGDPILHRAVADSDSDLVHELLEYGADPDAPSRFGETPLLRAIRDENLSLVELLLEREADPNGAPEGEETPLLCAVGQGNMAVARRLIEEGAAFDGPGMLASAFANRDDPLMNLLLHAGADPESTFPGTGKRVFDAAVEQGATGAVRTLLSAGASIGDNLWAALLTGQDDLVNLILDNGGDPRTRGPGGEDPLDYCLSRERYRAARLLLEAGADPNARYDGDQTWLVKAVVEGNAPLADALLDHGAKPPSSGRAPDGHTLLGWAIAHEMTEVAIGLIEAGVDVEAYEREPAISSFREKFDSTTFRYHLRVDGRIRAMMMAAAQRNHAVAQALMDAGAKGNVYSRKWLFPVSIGSWYKDVKMMQIALWGHSPEVQPRKAVIDLSDQRLTLYENGVAVYSSRVSTGKSGYRTPTGEYVISDKHRHHNSSIYGSSMPFFQRFSCSAFGLHQGYVPNYPASHGCIRLPYESAKFLFNKMKVGDYCVIQP